MFLSKDPNGYWYLYYRDDSGKRLKVSTKTKLKSEANSYLRKFNQQQKDSALVVDKLSNLCQIVCDSISRTHTKKTIQSIQTAFNELVRNIGDLNPLIVTSMQIDHFISIKVKEASQWTGLKYLRAISSVYNHASRMGYQLNNPCKNVLPPKPPIQIPLYMSQEDVDKLMTAITNIPFRRLCIFALSTGMRLGELVALRWEHVNMGTKTVTVQNTDVFTTKNKRNRTIPLSDTALRMINEIMSAQKSSKYIFLTPKGFPWSEDNVGQSIRRYINKSGLNPRYHFHTLRHTFASWLVQKGVNIYEVKELLGHSNITTTQIYVHLQPETLHSTVNKITLLLN